MAKTPLLTEVFATCLLRETGPDDWGPGNDYMDSVKKNAAAKPPGPKLKALIDAGIARVDDTGTYLAKAEDGTEVQLGHETSDPAGIERYLTANPSPDTW